MSSFRKIKADAIKDNPFSMIATDWMLISAGNIKSFNTMTASWGFLGHLWNRDCAVIFIRPTRHTYLFTEKNDYFTLSFFEEAHRETLKICGSTSGKNFDKMNATGLIAEETEHGNVYFQQARLVVECKKIYSEDIKKDKLIDASIDKLYPQKDYHRMYIGEIIQVLTKNQ